MRYVCEWRGLWGYLRSRVGYWGITRLFITGELGKLSRGLKHWGGYVDDVGVAGVGGGPEDLFLALSILEVGIGGCGGRGRALVLSPLPGLGGERDPRPLPLG